MIYIFDMNHGRMMTFEMALGFDSVGSLMSAIERQYAIPVSSQVLLISGGETLNPTSRVCSYSAGTDTNPIFMFSRDDSDQKNLSAPWPNIENDTDMKSEVDRCLELPAEYKTVVQRAQLAQTFLELGKEELNLCDKLVHEQHLQHQGWMAVIANMEDLTSEFIERCSDFSKVFEDHIGKRHEYKDNLDSFDDDLEKLAHIPILSPLIQGAEQQPCQAFDDVYVDAAGNSYSTNNLLDIQKPSNEEGGSSSTTTTSSENTSSNKSKETNEDSEKKSDDSSVMTLLQWISSTENQRTLKFMAENCGRELEMFEKNVMDSLKDDIEKTVDQAKREDFKEIKGLEARLQGLETLMHDARKVLQEQQDLATAFQQNQARAGNLGDQSILPDLCASHKNQLLVLLRNHKKLRDIRNRCGRAKDELGHNLYQRLKFVIHIENRMYEIDNRLLFYHTCLRRLQKHLGIVEQIHQAPCVYVQAVTEVVRRRIFSTAFLMWSSDLARHLLTIYNEEVLRRQTFRFSFDGHFLNSLFPGIEDFPPKFATEAPSVFDSELPKLSKTDLEELSKHLPDITKTIQLPNLSAIVEFFSSRSSQSNQDSSKESVNPSNKKFFSLLTQMKEFDRGFDSETDTEEYEKIGQMSIDRQTKPANMQSMGIGTDLVEMKNMATSSIFTCTDCEMMTDDNMERGLEVDKLKRLLATMFRVSKEAILLLRKQIDEIKCDATNQKENLQSMITDLLKSYEELKIETRNHERELEQRLTVDHELEMNDLKKELLNKDDEIHTFRLDNERLESLLSAKDKSISEVNEKCKHKVEELEHQIRQLQEKLVEVQHEKELAVKDVRDKLTSSHRNEMESLRCKFKLMTSMERSPSDTSLEKIERPDVIDITSHETMMRELKQKYEIEIKIAVKNAVEKEREKIMESSMNKLSVTTLGTSPGKSPKDSQDILKRIIDEKDKQLDQMREREQFLIREQMKLKETIQSLTDMELNESQLSLFKEKFETMQKEKLKLEKNLEREKARRVKLSALTQENSGVTINSCSTNDLVLIVWNSVHENYMIVQDSSALYFLHADSYPVMKLNNFQSGTCPRVSFCIGRVTDKEYCHAKKDENRYKVSKGTKFYRIKTRPRSPARLQKSEDENSKSTTTLERQPSFLTDSFSQTETSPKLLDLPSTHHIISPDMVDSGVDSTHKERNISVTEEDEECLSFTEDRFKVEPEEIDSKSKSNETETGETEKVEDPDEASLLLHKETFVDDDLASLNDSDEYRSLEGKDEDDTEL